jgi:hypothetical protein
MFNTRTFKGKKINLVKFNFVEKGGSTGKRSSSACGIVLIFFVLCID